MKKAVRALLGACLACACLLGCASVGKQAPGTAENEILTYTKIDPDKTVLVVSRTGNIDAAEFSEAFMAQNPDVQIVLLDVAGGNSEVKPVSDWVQNGQAPDIMIVTISMFDDAFTQTYFENLSANPVIEHYESESLNRVAVNGNVYWLPGPSQIDCMIYNKTLFTQYGWNVPKTFDELIDLCVQIREDTAGEVDPWNPNAKYSDEFKKAIEAFTYLELFGGMENRAWYEEYCAGKATFAGHMEPFYAAIQRLIDNGLLREEYFTYSATERGKEFAAGKIAMCNRAIATFEESEYEFSFMPFPTTVGRDGFVCGDVRFVVGVPKKEHTKAEQDAIDRYLAFFSSVEGQKILIGNQLMVSNVKGVPLNQAEKLAPLVSTIENGKMFAALPFTSPLGRLNFSARTDALAMLKGERTAEECIAAVDAMPFAAAAEPEAALATAKENFTILETSNYIADMYREQAGADVGLINNNVAFRGNLMKIFAGPLTASHVNALLPRSFANGSTLVKAAMTGRQLLDALNHPLGNEETTNSIYAFSGMQCEVAPWNAPGEKFLSVKLANGKPIDPEQTYTVAFWQGTVDDAYITEVLETFPGTWEERMQQKLTAQASIAPAKDGRITLVWP